MTFADCQPESEGWNCSWLLKDLSKSRYYKERQVDRKKRKAILGDSSAFVMGAMFLASALNRGSHPLEIFKNTY